MSELQDAIGRLTVQLIDWDDVRDDDVANDVSVAVEAARKYANPDIEAVARLIASMDGLFEFDEYDTSYQQGWLTKAKKLVEQKWPDLEGKIKLYEEETPLLEAFGVAEKIDAAISGVIPLPSGGNLFIEETHAMTVIDVNSGTMQRGTSPEGVYLATNLEAAKAIAGELRFQNLSGLITVDFIDLPGKAAQEKVLEALDAALARDPLSVERTGFNRFGLLSLRRKRRGKTLKTMLEGN